MNGIDYVVLAVILLILCGAGFAIYRTKKSGRKCIGCPNSGACSGSCEGCQKK